jgi:hypothetical protein
VSLNILVYRNQGAAYLTSLAVSAWLVQRFLADSQLRQELEGHLAYLPVADETEYPVAARQRFFNHLATAMLLDVGMLRPAGV